MCCRRWHGRTHWYPTHRTGVSGSEPQHHTGNQPAVLGVLRPDDTSPDPPIRVHEAPLHPVAGDVYRRRLRGRRTSDSSGNLDHGLCRAVADLNR